MTQETFFSNCPMTTFSKRIHTCQHFYS